MPQRGRGRRAKQPRILAVFSYRYDAHLIPDLIQNIRPVVDGWISWDDRRASSAFTADNVRRTLLIQAAYDAGARWVLGIDPDERLEQAAAWKLPLLIRVPLVQSWSFRLRELYAPDVYRVDGIWGRKRQTRLFRLHDHQFPIATAGSFETRPLHDPWAPHGRPSGINLYHLKMITPERRRARSALYNALDPERRYQKIGYDYLADEAGAEFEQVPRRRRYLPAHVEDGGLWMAAPEGVSEKDRL